MVLIFIPFFDNKIFGSIYLGTSNSFVIVLLGFCAFTERIRIKDANILNEIFSNAFLEQKKIQWAKDWIGFAEELLPSVFKDFKVTQYANILEMKKDPQFQNALNELSDTWITQNKLDKNLFEKFKKI